jgi:predicted protein tyrosine phosphatase
MREETMTMRILSEQEARHLLLKEPGVWNVISIYAPGFDKMGPELESCCADLQKLAFHDSWTQRDRDKGDTLPEERHIRKAIEFAADKDKLLVHCWAGVSRSAAVAFIVACSRGIAPAEALEKLLDPMIHAPNPLVVELGAEVLRNPEILRAFKAWDQKAVDMLKKENE